MGRTSAPRRAPRPPVWFQKAASVHCNGTPAEVRCCGTEHLPGTYGRSCRIRVQPPAPRCRSMSVRACTAVPQQVTQVCAVTGGDSMNRWILALVAMLAISIPSFASDKKQSAGVEDQIKALQEQGRQAALKGDTSFQEKYLADDYVAINASGQEASKQEVIQNRKSGALKYDDIQLRNQKIRVYGNTAIVDSNTQVKGSMNGQPIDGEYRTRFVWVKQGNDWKMVSFQ